MSEPTRITAAEQPVLGLVEMEVRRALDRAAIPAVRALLGEARFLTSLSLTRISDDDEVPMQSEILEVRYGLVVDQGALPEDHASLWDQLTDVFYGYDDEVGEIVDLRQVRSICNGIELDGFSGYDFDGFREPGYGQSVVGLPTEMFENDWEEANERARPRAVAGCPAGFVLGDADDLDEDDVSTLVRRLIATFAAVNELDPVDPELIEGTDSLFALTGYDDGMTTALCSNLLLQVDVLAAFPEHVMITVDCAVRVLGEIREEQSTTIHDRLRAYGMFEMSAGDQKESLGCGMVCIECLTVEEQEDGVTRTFSVCFQCDASPVISYGIAVDGTATVLSYTDEHGNASIEDSRYFEEMLEDLGD